MKTKAQFLDEILSINPKYDADLIGKAYDKGRQLHDGQLRKSGEPYFIHPINVAIILAHLGMDEATLIGGLLHDVVEDTDYTRDCLLYTSMRLRRHTISENSLTVRIRGNTEITRSLKK